MINVEMSDDIRKYETKTIGPFTSRQLVCLGIALSYAVPMALFLPLEIDSRIVIAAIAAVPVILCGYIKMDGLKFEGIIMRMLYLYYLTPAKRKCKCENTFRQGINQIKLREEKRKLNKMTPKQQKMYEKKKTQQKQVTYSNKKQFKVYR